MRFQGFIRIHRHQGTIKCPVPFKVEDEKKENVDAKIKNAEDSEESQSISNDVAPQDGGDGVTDHDQSNDRNKNHHQNHNKAVEGHDDQTMEPLDIKWMDQDAAAVVAAKETRKSSASGWLDSLSRALPLRQRIQCGNCKQ